MKLSKCFILILFLYFLSECNGLNILVLTPFGSNSVQVIFWTLCKGLLNQNHSVTIITSGSSPISNKNLTHYQAPHSSLDKIDMFEVRAGSDYIQLWGEIFPKVIKEMYLNPSIMNLWKRRNEFDIVILNAAANEMASPFLMDLKAPFLTLAPAGIEPVQLSHLGNIVSPAALPFISLPFSDYMTLRERIKNTLLILLYRYGFNKKIGKKVYKSLQEFFPSIEYPWDYYVDQSGTLINRHHVLDGAIPLLPNQVEIGCITCQSAKKLSQEYLDWIEGSPKGVIYFSLGSWQSTRMPKEYLKILLNAFEQLPHRVIMVGNQTEHLPSNVKAWKIVPQQDILGHPSVVAFITHCGLNSVSESTYHGVPIIGLPIAFDQPRVCARRSQRGEAILLSWNDLTPGKIIDAVTNITNDNRYKTRVNLSSKQFQAQKEESLEKAVWFIEHIHEFGKNNFVFSGASLKLMEYLLLDVVLVCSVIVLPCMLLIWFVAKRLFYKVLTILSIMSPLRNTLNKEKLM